MIYFDGKKKKKKRSNLISPPGTLPAGSGGEQPEGKNRSSRRLFQVYGEARPRVVRSARYS